MDKDRLVQRQVELVRIIEAVEEVLKCKGWQILQESVFTPLAKRIERQLLSEAKKSTIEPDKIYVLQGELATAQRYDLVDYVSRCKKELDGIKLNLK